jgi:hypothetical protein
MRFDKTISLLLLFLAFGCSEDNPAAQSIGQGGSTTRYTIQDHYLYVVDDVSLRVYDIADKKFVQVHEAEIGFGIETIFSRPDYLYLGASDGMYIFDLVDPQVPAFVFRYDHILSCDPVVVQGNRAYVTLSAMAENCNRGVNVLEIIDITDRYSPRLVTDYPMNSPRGISVDGDLLFVCEGPHGLKVLDISNEFEIKELQALTSHHAFDVIAGSNRLTVTGQDGIFQYSYPAQGAQVLDFLSKIPVNLK